MGRHAAGELSGRAPGDPRRLPAVSRNRRNERRWVSAALVGSPAPARGAAPHRFPSLEDAWAPTTECAPRPLAFAVWTRASAAARPARYTPRGHGHGALRSRRSAWRPRLRATPDTHVDPHGHLCADPFPRPPIALPLPTSLLCRRTHAASPPASPAQGSMGRCVKLARHGRPPFSSPPPPRPPSRQFPTHLTTAASARAALPLPPQPFSPSTGQCVKSLCLTASPSSTPSLPPSPPAMPSSGPSRRPLPAPARQQLVFGPVRAARRPRFDCFFAFRGVNSQRRTKTPRSSPIGQRPREPPPASGRPTENADTAAGGGSTGRAATAAAPWTPSPSPRFPPLLPPARSTRMRGDRGGRPAGRLANPLPRAPPAPPLSPPPRPRPTRQRV